MERSPRLSIDISLEQRKKINEHMPWGTQRKIFQFIIDKLILAFEEHGSAKVIGALITESIKLEEFLSLKLKG